MQTLYEAIKIEKGSTDAKKMKDKIAAGEKQLKGRTETNHRFYSDSVDNRGHIQKILGLQVELQDLKVRLADLDLEVESVSPDLNPVVPPRMGKHLVTKDPNQRKPHDTQLDPAMLNRIYVLDTSDTRPKPVDLMDLEDTRDLKQALGVTSLEQTQAIHDWQSNINDNDPSTVLNPNSVPAAHRRKHGLYTPEQTPPTPDSERKPTIRDTQESRSPSPSERMPKRRRV
ncbi:hypothetical protein F4821DRAFT_261401 [Hypoxylon rubiginosum]|uniref:Uncharacterized protein n=1 Tax=Hypoxylon rubiginosum TaxID=110542 RepID=A0ACC0CX15_9PEZI|nr:hypothetical protein F4821DRAFT_261401 [Hypoxylon rubiginosum]